MIFSSARTNKSIVHEQSHTSKSNDDIVSSSNRRKYFNECKEVEQQANNDDADDDEKSTNSIRNDSDKQQRRRRQRQHRQKSDAKRKSFIIFFDYKDKVSTGLVAFFMAGLVICLFSAIYAIYILDKDTNNGTGIPPSVLESSESVQEAVLEDAAISEKAAQIRRSQQLPENPQEPDTIAAVVAESAMAHPINNMCMSNSLCRVVGTFVKARRKDILADPKSEWTWYLPHIQKYYEQCNGVSEIKYGSDTNTIKILEIGEPTSGFGALSQYMLSSPKLSAKHTDIIEYHVVDSFTVKKGMVRALKRSAPKATAEEISDAWSKSMLDSTLGVMPMSQENRRQKMTLQIHNRLSNTNNIIQSFSKETIDVMLIDNVKPTFQEIQDAEINSTPSQIMNEWLTKLKPGGTVILVKSHADTSILEYKERPGADDDVIEKSQSIIDILYESQETRGINVRVIDKDVANYIPENGEIVPDISESIDCTLDDPVLKKLPALLEELTVKKVRIDRFAEEVIKMTGLEPTKNCTRDAKVITTVCEHPETLKENEELLFRICMEHQVEIPDPEKAKVVDESLLSSSTCKTLWFAGFHEGMHSCTERELYAQEYSAALNSALENAKETLQPVLVLGRYGLPNENSTELSKVGLWAQAQGAKVIVWPRLSFQDKINLTSHGITGPEHSNYAMGPFMRLDIPRILDNYKLFDDPNICKQHILYTDSDVIFAGNITRYDLELLKYDLQSSQDAIVSYGREFEMEMEPAIQNTGIMMMDVQRFDKEWPSILEYTLQQEKFPLHDQFMLNAYFSKSEENERKRVLIPIYWNWKTYWQMNPGRYDLIKVIHFHGPKPGKGLEDLAFCDLDALDPDIQIFRPLIPHIYHGICCDQGRTAAWALDLFHKFAVPRDQICSVTV